MLYIFVRNSRRITYKSNYNYYYNNNCMYIRTIRIYIFMYTCNIKNKLHSWVDRWMDKVSHRKCIGEWDVQGDVARHAAVDSTSIDPGGSGLSDKFFHFLLFLLISVSSLRMQTIWIWRKLLTARDCFIRSITRYRFSFSFSLSFTFFVSFFCLCQQAY